MFSRAIHSQVCTAAAVTSMVSGVAVGLLALGERLPASPAARLARLASWSLIMAGVTGLAAGSGALFPCWNYSKEHLLTRVAGSCATTEVRMLRVDIIGTSFIWRLKLGSRAISRRRSAADNGPGRHEAADVGVGLSAA